MQLKSPHNVRGVVTVIPAHNEQQLLPACLRSLRRAADSAPIPVTTIVVLDSCSDGSAFAVGDFADVLVVEYGNVGAARAAGFSASGSVGREDVWFTTTDADSAVPESWYVDQLDYWPHHDVVVGKVRVDWSTHSERTRRRYDNAYRLRGNNNHGHIHGANLGMRADLYHRVGGFRPLAVAEDVDLVERMRDAGALIAWDERNVVTTSDRRTPRARGGFGDHLRGLEHDPQTHRPVAVAEHP
ncbi:glycosyl transferase family 2 [Rhodococcus sp. SRB_17]|nr:glycosyl transferase family 2 [Rhodococcus sp. SRB_17]